MASGGGEEPSCGLDVSGHASGPQRTQQPPSGGQLPHNEALGANWHRLVASLEKIGRDLVEEEDKTLRVEMHHVFRVAISQLREHGSPPVLSRDAIGRQLKTLKRKMDVILEGKAPQKDQTWASVAAAAAQATRNTTTAQRLTVRVRIANSEGKSPAELLATVKPVIQGVYVVRPLRSGDVE